MTLFVMESDGRYCKYEETHFQRAYDTETVKQPIREAGIELAAV